MGLLGMSVGNVAKHGAKHRVARESHGGEYRDREFVDSREYRDSRDSFWEVRDRGRARQGSECRERESRETLDSRDSRDSGHSDPFTFPPAAFSHYCHSCDRRSRLQDHHCGVVGTCIHAGNRSLFVRFVELSGLSLALFLPSFWVLVSHQWELLLYSTDILRAEPRAPLDEAIIWRYFYLVLPMVFVLQSVGLLFFHVFVLGQQYSYNAHAHQVEALYATLCRDTPAQTWPVSQVAKMLEADGSITLSMMQTLHSKSVSTRFTEDLISDIRLRSPYAYTQTYAV
ncbi:hypothetical protein B484DRAFT_458751 [Ochromonadaceae sp. CCMP2298]|nr:hypothetical protein B484DRAFT_458751 [Ochromonadaceae sp. CCMP2298]